MEYDGQEEAYEDRKQRLRSWQLSTMHPSDPDYPEDEDDDISGSSGLRSDGSDCGSDSAGGVE